MVRQRNRADSRFMTRLIDQTFVLVWVTQVIYGLIENTVPVVELIKIKLSYIIVRDFI